MCLLPMLEQRERGRRRREQRAQRAANPSANAPTNPTQSSPPAEAIPLEAPIRVVQPAPAAAEKTTSKPAAPQKATSPKASSPPTARVPKHVARASPRNEGKKSMAPKASHKKAASKSAPKFVTSPPPPTTTTTTTNQLAEDTTSDEGSGTDDADILLQRTPPSHGRTAKLPPLPSPSKPPTVTRPRPQPPAPPSNYMPPYVEEVPESPPRSELPPKRNTRHRRSASRHVHWAPSVVSRHSSPHGRQQQAPAPALPEAQRHHNLPPPAPPSKPSAHPCRAPPMSTTAPTSKPRRSVRWEVESQSDVGVDAGPSATDDLPRALAPVSLDVVIEKESSVDGSGIDDSADVGSRMPRWGRGVGDEGMGGQGRDDGPYRGVAW